MQGLDYKAEVDRRIEKVMVSVESQMGYVPDAVEKQLFYVQLLKVRWQPHAQCCQEADPSHTALTSASTHPHPHPTCSRRATLTTTRPGGPATTARRRSTAS
jgi:hypothetical protein